MYVSFPCAWLAKQAVRRPVAALTQRWTETHTDPLKTNETRSKLPPFSAYCHCSGSARCWCQRSDSATRFLLFQRPFFLEVKIIARLLIQNTGPGSGRSGSLIPVAPFTFNSTFIVLLFFSRQQWLLSRFLQYIPTKYDYWMDTFQCNRTEYSFLREGIFTIKTTQIH